MRRHFLVPFPLAVTWRLPMTYCAFCLSVRSDSKAEGYKTSMQH